MAGGVYATESREGSEYLLSYNLNITEVALVGHPGGLKGKEKRGDGS